MRRILAIGDIHGCSTALETLLTFADLQPTDTLVTLGDYIDRGPDTRGVLDRLIALSRTHHLVALRGNHELMLMDARDDRTYPSRSGENLAETRPWILIMAR